MDFKVTTHTNKVNGEITQKTESEMTPLYVQVIKTQEKGFRDALIALGWTPPKDKK